MTGQIEAIDEFETPVHPQTVWTAANIQEALPGLIAPLTWSLMRTVFDYGFSEPARRAGVYMRPQDPYVVLFYGRAFLNATALREAAERIPISSSRALDEHYLGVSEAIRPAGFELPDLRRGVVGLPVLSRMVWIQLRTGTDVRRVEGEIRRMEARDRALPLASYDATRLFDEVEGALDMARDVAATHISISGGTSVYFEWLGYVTRAWLDDKDGSLQATLCSGLAEVESARPGKALWELSRRAMASPVLLEALGAPDAEAALAGLRDWSQPEVRAFVAAYGAFLARFGHRCVMETELSAFSWEEDPGAVFGLIRQLIDGGPEADPNAIEERQRYLRQLQTRVARRRLSLWQRPLFDLLLAETQRFIVLRERTKSLLVRGTNRSRRLLRLAGRRLQESRRLAATADLFYLTMEEARAVAQGRPPADLPQRLERRRDAEECNRRLVLPETFRGRPQPLAIEVAPSATVLRGIAVSPGRTTGRARVLLDPRTAAPLQPGDILVAPVTDAAWTPLFLTAAALVVDIGGPLSHGATVARELGLPAVVNVKNATRLIHDGQRITVDGRLGTVELGEAP